MTAAGTVDLSLSRHALRQVVIQVFAIIALVLAIDLAIEGPAETPRPWSVRIIAFITLLACGLALAEGYLRWVTRRWPAGRVPVIANVATAIIGSILGFSIAEIIALVAGEGRSSLTWATGVEVLVAGPVWIMLIGTAVLTRWRYLAERDSLMVELVRTEALRQEESGLLDAARSAMRDPISASVQSIRNSVSEHLAPEALIDAGTSASLRRAALDVVRPLSHAIWQQSELPPTPRHPWRFLRRVISTQPFRPGLVAAVYVASALATNVSLYGAGAGLVFLATDVAFIVAVLGAANVAMRRWVNVHALLYLATLLVIHVLPLLPKVAGLEETSPQETGAGRVAEIVISLALIVGTSSLGLLREGRDARLAALRREVDAEWLQRAAEAHDISKEARSLATTLHGSVQGTLLHAAAAIDDAIERRDAAAITAILSNVSAALADLPHAPEPTPTGGSTLGRQLDELIESWFELCSVELHLGTQLHELDGHDAHTIATVVREGIVNAYRHGDAQEIRIRIDPGPDGYDITITDDGRGPREKIWGLGLTTIDRASAGHWTLTREHSVTTLRVVLPRS